MFKSVDRKRLADALTAALGYRVVVDSEGAVSSAVHGDTIEPADCIRALQVRGEVVDDLIVPAWWMFHIRGV